MPEGELITWCDHDPSTRYRAIASALTIFRSTNEGEPPRWTNLSLRLLDRAYDRIAVLKTVVAQIELISCGSPGATLASNVKPLDTLQAHTDPAVAQFAAQESVRLGQIADAQRRAAREAERGKDERFE
jgi:hypothetical protein